MQELLGRKLLLEEIREEREAVNKLQKVEKFPAMKELDQKRIECLRCRSIHLKAMVKLTTAAFYCPECIQLGRVTSNQEFFHLAEPKSEKRAVAFSWNGQLTAGQSLVSRQLLQSVKSYSSQLVWAVTGAGKTEILFETLFYSLKQGHRIGIASPRVDVCLELFPRIQEAFPQEELILLHGKMTEPYRYTKLLICTTHQLLRFYRAFDLLIIDEVDSFPFVNNPALQQAIFQAVKKKSSLVYLTATPTPELESNSQKGKLSVAVLPARYHRRKLPVPQTKWCSNWIEKINRKQLPKALLNLVRQLLEKNNLLIFCPRIDLMDSLKASLLNALPDLPIECVYAADEQRIEKVMKMRKQAFRILITSTILERGVTFERVSVIVLGANHQVFTIASLVQIAGRVDRKADFTAGEVWFLHDGQTRSMKAAIQQIKKMNLLAKERGLVDEMPVL